VSTQLAFYEAWRDLMRSWGFTVLEADGWRTRDAEPGSTYLPGVKYLEHHDASTPLSGNWGALAYIVANKLANVVTARDGTLMLTAAGVCWHAGAGSYPGVPTNGLNPLSLGNEVCNSGSEPYDPRCTRAIIASEKAWAIVSGRTAADVLGHKEWGNRPPGGWPGRKTDPSLDMNERRAAVAAFTPDQEDDMPLNDADAQKVADKLLRTRLKLKDGSTPQVGSILVGIIDRLKSQATTLGEHGIQLDDIEDYVDGDAPAEPPAA
jgi:hypothetical protein